MAAEQAHSKQQVSMPDGIASDGGGVGVTWQLSLSPENDSALRDDSAASKTLSAAAYDQPPPPATTTKQEKHSADGHSAEAADPVRYPVDYDHKALAKDMTERLCPEMLFAGSKDNITTMFILFPDVRI